MNSRYYDANTCRFINADSPEYVSIQGGNLFAYCLNDPINQSDSNGNIAFTLARKIFSAVLGGIFGGISVLISDILISAINKTKLKFSKWYEYSMAVVDGALEVFLKSD